MIRKSLRFLTIGMCSTILACSCNEITQEKMEPLPEPAILSNELSFSLPISFQLWDGSNSITITPLHDRYLGSCIKKKVPHISIIWYKNTNGRVKAYVDNHICYWQKRNGQKCRAFYLSGEFFKTHPGIQKPCYKYCSNPNNFQFDLVMVRDMIDQSFRSFNELPAWKKMYIGALVAPVAFVVFAPMLIGVPADISLPPFAMDCTAENDLTNILPHEFNPNLTVVARDSTGLHVIGSEADQYHFVQYYADPNPAGLPAIWVEGDWNGFSTGFIIPYGFNKFAPAKQQGANLLPAGGVNTRVADGVQVINGEFVLTCGNRVSNENLLTEADMIHYPIECVRDVEPSELLPQNLRPELVVLTRRWGLHVIGHDADQYRFCQWYADPNSANMPAIWNEGRWDGQSMYFEEPYGYNKFTPAKQQGQGFLPAGDPNTRVSEGVQVVNNGFSYTCNQRTSNAQVLSDQDYLPVVQPPDNQGLYLERSDSQIFMENGAHWPYILWWAVPNPNNLTSVWLQRNFDANNTYFDIPQGRNHFVIAETNINPRPEQFYPVGSYEAQLGAGITISDTDFVIDLY